MNDDPKTLWNDLVRLSQPTLDAVQARCATWRPSADENDRTIYLGNNLVLEAIHSLHGRELFGPAHPEAGAISQLLLVVSPTRYTHDTSWRMQSLPDYTLCGISIRATAAEFLAAFQTQGRGADVVPSTLTDIFGHTALLLSVGKNLQIEFRSDDASSSLPESATPYTIAFTFSGADQISPDLK